MAWSSSNRSERLPDDWPDIKRAVKRQAAGLCQADTHMPDCDGKGAEADHITPGDNHALTNLQWLSTPCHKEKTRRETIARNKRYAQLKRRPRETHPGRITP